MTLSETDQVVIKTAEDILAKLGLEAEINLSKDRQKLEVVLKDRESGVLIGYHGENLNSFQHLLKMIVYQKTSHWPSLMVEVGGYRENRERVLENMALSAARRVKTSGRVLALPPLPAFERRIVHLVLAREEGIIAESEGEGRGRRIMVKPAERREDLTG
ncbi:MAG: KH domain-containing protein [Candidatus Pacebacteria bacterium]|nr:KH domain-containing protein [Candidatus Paceibacterota bacterium]